MKRVIIEISAHHCHLSKKDLVILFGENYQLKPVKLLSQTGQYAAAEKIAVKTSAGQIKNIRVLGPIRKDSQIELTKTDCYHLQIDPPVAECTCQVNKKNCIEVKLVGPRGVIKRCAAMIALRHFHCDPKTAKKLGLRQGQLISIKTTGPRSMTFHNVLVRIRKDFVARVHLDTDEANAAAIKSGQPGYIVTK